MVHHLKRLKRQISAPLLPKMSLEEGERFRVFPKRVYHETVSVASRAVPGSEGWHLRAPSGNVPGPADFPQVAAPPGGHGGLHGRQGQPPRGPRWPSPHTAGPLPAGASVLSFTKWGPQGPASLTAPRQE